MVRRRECDAVLVWKLDRLSRSQKDTLYLLEDVFLANGCGFVSMLENFDTSTAFGRAMVGILSVFAQLEREQFKERSAIGRVGRAKAGLFHGGGYAPIGYDYYTKEDGGQGLVVNEYEAMQVREVYRLYLAGWAVHKIQVYMHERYTTKNGCWASRHNGALGAVVSDLPGAHYLGGKPMRASTRLSSPRTTLTRWLPAENL